jgi:predicted dienelactone hydrolase
MTAEFRIAVLLVSLGVGAAAQAPAHFSVAGIATRPQAASSEPLIELPKPTGARRVGRTSFHMVDSTRREAMTPDPDDFRELVMHVWYPSDDTRGTPAAYLDASFEDSTTRAYYGGLRILDQLARVRARAFANARMSDASRRYPVVLFSHGLALPSEFYTSYIENLASEGYVVVGVEHSWFGGAFTLPGGRPVVNRSAAADRQRDVVTQAEDLSFVVTVLDRLNRAGPAASRLAGRLDMDHVGVFGHSRGGFAAPHACRLDRRFKACLNLDGYSMTPAVMDSGITQPFMMVEEIAPWDPPPADSMLAAASMTRAQSDSQVQAAFMRRENTFARMTGGAYLVVSPGAVHQSFSDLGVVIPDRYPTARQDFRRTIEIVRAYMLAFFDTHLRGKPSPLLRAKSERYPEAWLTIYRPGQPKQVFRGAPTWRP